MALGGFGTLVGMLFFVMVAMKAGSWRSAPSTVSAPALSPAAPTRAPTLQITVEKTDYADRYLKLVGVVKNIGDGPEFSPGVLIRVFGKDGTMLLTHDTA